MREAGSVLSRGFSVVSFMAAQIKKPAQSGLTVAEARDEEFGNPFFAGTFAIPALRESRDNDHRLSG